MVYDDDNIARDEAPSKPIAAVQFKSLMKRLEDRKLRSWNIMAVFNETVGK